MMIVLLRHGERWPDPADALRPAGEARARLLAQMLADSGVAHAFCSDYVRTAQMLAPLEQKLGPALAITAVPLKGQADDSHHINTIVNAVKTLPPTAVAVVVGHNTTVGPVIEQLGGGVIAPINHNEFDKLFVLSVTPAGTSLLQLRYGEPT